MALKRKFKTMSILLTLAMLFMLWPGVTLAESADTISVTTESELIETVANAVYANYTISIDQDITLNSPLTINQNVVLTSASGKTLNAGVKQIIIPAEKNVTFGGDLKVQGSASPGVVNVQGTFTLADNASVTADDNMAVYTYSSGTINITGGSVKASGVNDYALLGMGSSGTVTVSGGVIEGDHTGIYATGEGFKANISGGEIKGQIAFFVGSEAEADISGGHFIGTTNAVDTGGTVDITGGTFTGNILTNSSSSLNITSGTVAVNNGVYYYDSGVNRPFLTSLPSPVDAVVSQLTSISLTGVYSDVNYSIDPTSDSNLGAAINNETDTVTLTPTAAGSRNLVLTATANSQTFNLTIPVTVTTTQLATPINLTWDDTTTPGAIKAKWDAVPNASNYYVYLYKDGHICLETLEDTNERNFRANLEGYGTGNYTFKVKAVGNGTTYTDSLQSAVSAPYTYTPPPVPAVTVMASAAASTPLAGADNEITLTVRNSSGDTDTTFTGVHEVTVSGVQVRTSGLNCGSFYSYSIPDTGTLTTEVIFTNGVAKPSLSLFKAGVQTISFSVAGVLNPSASVNLTVVPRTPAVMTLTRDITAPTANGGHFAQQPILKFTDSYANLCTNDSTTQVTATKYDGGEWTLTGTTTVTAVNGIVTFTDLGATNTERVTGAQIRFTPTAATNSSISGEVTLPATGTSSSGGGGGGGTTPAGTLVTPTGTDVADNGVSLSFPAGAVESDIRVQVRQASLTSGMDLPADSQLISRVVDIVKNKSGDFSEPVTITMSFNRSQIDLDKYDIRICYFDEDSREWVELDNIEVDLASGTISGEVTHFTKFAVIATLKANEKEEPPLPPAPQPKPELPADLAGHWAKESVAKLINAGVISGYPDGSFQPDKTVTRAEFIVMLVKALQLEPQAGSEFKDTSAHWAGESISTAAAHGLISGYDQDTFGPDNLITREQAAVILARAARLEAGDQTLNFTDAQQIAPWALSGVAAAVSKSYLSGYPDNSFRPQGNTTRAEAAAIIAKLL